MSETRTPVDTQQLTRAIASVPGVLKAEVVVSDMKGRGRLRIRVAPGEEPEAVTWAVAATLRERFGIALDPAAFRLRPSDDPITVDPGVPDPAAEKTATAQSATDQTPTHETTTHQTRADPSDDPTGPTMAAHELPGPDRDPIQVLEDAVAARLAARATPSAETAPTSAAERDRFRAAIGDLVTQQGGAALSVTATLEHKGRQARSAVDALATSRGKWRAVAEATIGALQDLTDGKLHAEVVRVTVATAEEPAIASVVLTVLADRGEETLVGAALLRDDTERAVMRATLAALNRRVEPWLAAATDA